MGSGKGGSREVYDILLSVDYGICQGPIYALNEIEVKDKPAFVGPLYDSGEVRINKPDLFGGDDAEGGPVGTVEFYNGAEDQLVSDHLAARNGLTPATDAGYRGLAHCFFRGESAKSAGGSNDPSYTDFSFWAYAWGTMLGLTQYAGSMFGFKWTANNPYFPTAAFRVTAMPGDLTGEFIYPVVDILNTYGTPTTPTLDGMPDFINDFSKTNYAAGNFPNVRKVPPAYNEGRALASNWNTENFDGLAAEFPVGDDTAHRNQGGDGALVVDMDASSFPDGTEFTLYALARIRHFSSTPVSKTARVSVYWYTEAETLDLDINGDMVSSGTLIFTNEHTSSSGSQDVDLGQVFVKPSGAKLIRFSFNLDNAWYWLGTDYVVYEQPTLNYDNPDLFEDPEWVVVSPGDAWSNGELDPTKLPDMNPADIIYACMTNTKWGKGEPPSAIDTASYTAAAAVFAAENFGLSMIFVEQDIVENFVQEVLDHVQAAHYIDRSTGLWTLKPIRGDYVAGNLPLFDESNCELDAIKTRLYGETVNEIIVEYTDPVSEELEQVSAQNTANIAIQQGVVSDTRTYYGIRNPYLAQFVAERDVSESSQALTSVVLKASREAEDLQIGDVIRFSWADEGIVETVLRINKVSYGDDRDRAIVLDCIQDFYATPSSEAFQVRQPPVLIDRGYPQQMTEAFALTPPLPPLIAEGFDVEAFDAEYPQSHLMFFAYDQDYSPNSVEAWQIDTLPTGGTGQIMKTTFAETGKGSLTVSLVPEERSVLPLESVEQALLGTGVVGDLLMIGSTEASSELIMLESYDAALEEWTVLRGVYDTIPETWPSGETIWNLALGPGQVDTDDMLPGVDETYKFRTRSPGGLLAYDDAQTVVATPSERLYRPFRPANVDINGGGFGTGQWTSTIPALAPITWSNRNRKDEDAAAVEWTAANVTPETGQTNTVRVVEPVTNDERILATGLTGTSYDMDTSLLEDYRFYTVEIWSVRDGLDSLRTSVRTLDLQRTGYGNNYGYDYGENDGE